ncbi:hypothetical protein U9M48_018376 [Paspalum notatum var. saurae]|uniref:Membrane-associated kinase regulator n=1 Tax=Paspalum notatum var. saurae TaxID=547442 RepID=A0AAQ3WQ38_PASNO
MSGSLSAPPPPPLPLPLPFKSHRPPRVHHHHHHHHSKVQALAIQLPPSSPHSTNESKVRSRRLLARPRRPRAAMQILRLLAARRFRRRRRAAVSTITATAPVTPRGGCGYGDEEDEGPFFDLDLSCCSAPASSAGSQAAESGSESDDYLPFPSSSAAADHLDDLVISLQRSRSASPSYEDRLLFFRGAAARPAPPPPPPPPPQLMFCASEPSDAASRARCSSSADRRGARLQLRTLSFGSAKAAFYGVGGRASFSRSASSSARSAAGRLFAAYASSSPDRPDLHTQDDARTARPPPSGDVFRRYLSKISSRLRRVAPAAAADLRLRKSRSASFPAQPASAAQSSPPLRKSRDDSLVEKQDGIASAIAHCKESLHRASVSELDTSLLRSQSDPGP